MKKILTLIFVISIFFNSNSQVTNNFVLKNTFECECKNTNLNIIQIIPDFTYTDSLIYYKFIIFKLDTINIGIDLSENIITLKSPSYFLRDTLLNRLEINNQNVNTPFKRFRYYSKNTKNKIALFGIGIHRIYSEDNFIFIIFDFATSHSSGISKIKLNKDLKLTEFWYFDGFKNYRCK